ncbi:MAG: heme-binding domain-containing protein [Anaerolineaceae bacterium]
MKKLYKVLSVLAAAVLAAFVIIQFLPYGKDQTNPPVISEPDWESPETRAIAKKACFDCHSNETVWPWYSNVAPMSWLVQQDVDEAREEMNFSEWERFASNKSAEVIIDMVQSGRMPPATYLFQHPEARLTDAEKELFFKGLSATLEK